MKEHVTLTQREQTRLQVLNSLMADHMTTEQAATLMGVSARHTRRILAAYSKEGAAALAHGNRGRRPANATSDPLATDVVVLARTRYAGVNHTHLSELLREREIDIGRNTLRKILTDAGMNSPRRRRPPKHRVRRQRMTREGMLIQILLSIDRQCPAASRRTAPGVDTERQSVLHHWGRQLHKVARRRDHHCVVLLFAAGERRHRSIAVL